MGAVLVQSINRQTNPPTLLYKMVHNSSVSYVQLYWTSKSVAHISLWVIGLIHHRIYICQCKLSELHDRSELTTSAKYVIKVSSWLLTSFMLCVFKCLVSCCFSGLSGLFRSISVAFRVSSESRFLYVNAPPSHNYTDHTGVVLYVKVFCC